MCGSVRARAPLCMDKYWWMSLRCPHIHSATVTFTKHRNQFIAWQKRAHEASHRTQHIVGCVCVSFHLEFLYWPSWGEKSKEVKGKLDRIHWHKFTLVSVKMVKFVYELQQQPLSVYTLCAVTRITNRARIHTPDDTHTCTCAFCFRFKCFLVRCMFGG